MKFLIDVNASGTLVQWLTDAGHDVVQVADEDARMADGDILQWANREERIIVTTDDDFEQMIWLEGRPHSGVLRLANLPRTARRALLEVVLNRHSRDLAEGAIVIADSTRIRIRRPLHGLGGGTEGTKQG